jgi:hypothetical protein
MKSVRWTVVGDSALEQCKKWRTVSVSVMYEKTGQLRVRPPCGGLKETESKRPYLDKFFFVDDEERRGEEAVTRLQARL